MSPKGVVVCAVALLLSGSIARFAMPAQRNGTAVLEGIVLVQGTQEPVSGARVSLVPRSIKSIPVGSSVSDSNGRFMFTGLLPGQYSLRAELEGYVGAMDQQTETALKLFGRGLGVTPISALPYASVSITVRPQSPGKIATVISLVATGAITGRLLDPEGRPLASGKVEVFRVQFRFGEKFFSPFPSVQSDDRGIFRAVGLVSGEYYLRAERRDLGNHRFLAAFYGGIHAAQARSVHLGSREVKGIDIQLSDLPLFRIAGRINFSGPKAEWPRVAEVAVTSTESPRTPPRLYRNVASGIGVFQIVDVPRGSYWVTPMVSGERFSAVNQSTRIEVADVDVSNVNLVVSPTLRVEGRLAAEGNCGTSFSLVTLVPAGVPPDGAWPPSVVWKSPIVDRNGQFSIDAVPQGDYRVRVSGMSLSCYVADAQLGGRSTIQDGLVTIRAGATPLNPVVRLGGGVLNGTVRTKGRTIPPRADLVLVPEAHLDRNFALYKRASADSNGRFTIRQITPGTYRLVALRKIDSGAEETREFLKAHSQNGKTIRIDLGQTASVEAILSDP